MSIKQSTQSKTTKEDCLRTIMHSEILHPKVITVQSPSNPKWCGKYEVPFRDGFGLLGTIEMHVKFAAIKSKTTAPDDVIFNYFDKFICNIPQDLDIGTAYGKWREYAQEIEIQEEEDSQE